MLFSTDPEVISPPKYTQMLLHSLRSESLEDLSISRPSTRLSWGVPVPHDEGHTIYVWFDALVNYLTVLGFPNEGWEREGWPASLQILGKDIVRSVRVPFISFSTARDVTTDCSLAAASFFSLKGSTLSTGPPSCSRPTSHHLRSSSSTRTGR